MEDQTFTTHGDMARAAWRAVCNGGGRVDAVTRRVFNKGASAGYAGGEIVPAIAAELDRLAKRGRAVSLRVDGVTFALAGPDADCLDAEACNADCA